MYKTENQHSQGHYKEAKTNNAIQFGSDFDITFDMTNEFQTTTKTRIDPFMGNTFDNTQPVQVRTFSKPIEDDMVNTLLVGTNTPSFHYIEMIPNTARSSISQNSQSVRSTTYSQNSVPINRPPISMLNLANTSPVQNQSHRPFQRPNSTISSRPNIKPKMYVFGFQDESKFIPRPFISSHKPKTTRSRTRVKKKEESQSQKQFVKPFKLSKKRSLNLEDSAKNYHNIYLGSLDDFGEDKYHGP